MPLIGKTQPYSKKIAHRGIGVEPELLAEIEYRAKSAEGKVRHPFFRGTSGTICKEHVGYPQEPTSPAKPPIRKSARLGSRRSSITWRGPLLWVADPIRVSWRLKLRANWNFIGI